MQSPLARPRRPSVCCLSLSVVCDVRALRPTQPIEIFGTVSTPFSTLALGEHELLLAPEITLSPALSSGTRIPSTYKAASLVTVCGDFYKTPESLLVLSPELVHLKTVYTSI